MRSRSGTDCAPSHLLTDWRLTFSCWASSSWDQPAFLRRAMILSAKIMVRSSFVRAATCRFMFLLYCTQTHGFREERGLGNLSTGGCGPPEPAHHPRAAGSSWPAAV